MSDATLDLIDNAIRDYELGTDAMRWSPDEPEPPTWAELHPGAVRQPGERVDYLDLTPDERELVHDWVRLHRLEPADIPLDGILERDDETGEWRIRQFRRFNGSLFLDGEEPACRIVRRRERAPLPWRCA